MAGGVRLKGGPNQRGPVRIRGPQTVVLGAVTSYFYKKIKCDDRRNTSVMRLHLRWSGKRIDYSCYHGLKLLPMSDVDVLPTMQHFQFCSSPVENHKYEHGGDA